MLSVPLELCHGDLDEAVAGFVLRQLADLKQHCKECLKKIVPIVILVLRYTTEIPDWLGLRLTIRERLMIFGTQCQYT